MSSEPAHPAGEFHASKPGAEPLTTSGHQVGQLVSEADHAPEFHAKTLPAGTAPPESTFTPNSTSEVPGQALDSASASNTEAGTTTSAADTLGGATSADVHAGLGRPVQGQSSHELKDNSGGPRAGLQGVGAGSAPSAENEGATKKDFTTPVAGATQKTSGSDFTPGSSGMGTTGRLSGNNDEATTK